MVDGLIEKQQVAPRCDQLGQSQAGTFSVAEEPDRHKHILAAEEEIVQEIPNLGVTHRCDTPDLGEGICLWVEPLLLLRIVSQANPGPQASGPFEWGDLAGHEVRSCGRQKDTGADQVGGLADSL